MPGAALLVTNARGLICVALACELPVSTKIYDACRVIGVDFLNLLNSLPALLGSGLGLCRNAAEGKCENRKERAEDDQSVVH